MFQFGSDISKSMSWMEAGQATCGEENVRFVQLRKEKLSVNHTKTQRKSKEFIRAFKNIVGNLESAFQ